MITTNSTTQVDQRKALQWATLLYLLFTVYSSLIPFQFETHPLAEAWKAYLGIGRVDLGRLSSTDWTSNVLLYIPLSFAWFGALYRPARTGWNWSIAALVLTGCAAISAAIEFAQVFLPVRTSSLYDLIANSAGAAAGLLLWFVAGSFLGASLTQLAESRALPVDPRVARIAGVGAVLYVLLLTLLCGWFTHDWHGVASALARADEVHWAPFYYYYGSGIPTSIVSGAYYTLIYVPAGALWLAWSRRKAQARPFENLPAAALWGVALATMMEASKLFLADLRPDTSTIMVAALASVTGWLAAYRFALHRLDGVSVGPHASPVTELRIVRAGFDAREAALRLIALLLTAIIVIALARFPVAALWLSAALLGYCAILWRYPQAWLVVLPALLPALDLVPWSGWFYLTEFDLFVAATLAVGCWRKKTQSRTGVYPRGLVPLLAVLAASYLISLLISMWPLQPWDYSSFSHYYSSYSGLIPAKGFFAALALLPFAQRELQRGTDVARHFIAGVLLGLCAVALITLWERLAYPGLLNFSREYRVAASFSSLHTGGAHLEAYLVIALPFVVAGIQFFRNTVVRTGLVLVFVLGSYALMMTFARAGYAGFAVSLTVLLVSMALAGKARRRPSWRLLLVPIGLAGLAILVAVPVLGGRFAQSRLAVAAEDLETRSGHWRETLNMMDTDWRTALFGMGLGRFPETYFFRSSKGSVPAQFRYVTESGNTFLRMGSGEPLYVEQIVPVEPGQRYALAFDARSTADGATLNILLCERTFFHSFGCESATVELQQASAGWKHYQVELSSRRLGGTPWYVKRPVKLSLENAQGKATVDVDNVSLGAGGENLVANGDFSHGNARWFFSSGDHLPWHIKNLPLEIYFEQGWLGVLIFATLATYALVRIMRESLGGNLYSCVTLAALSGFLAVGWFDSLFDAPRLILLFFLVIFIAMLREQQPSTAPMAQRVPDPVPLAAPSRSREVPAAHELHDSRQWRHAAIGIAVCAVMGWIVTHAPMVPYNVREMPNPYHPYLALVIFAIFLYWSFGLPAWIANWLTREGRRIWLYPAMVLLHGAGAWLMLHYAVLPESIHDVVGSPVLHWPWQWEMIGRFTALFGVLSLQLTGAALAVAMLCDRRGARALLCWLTSSAVLLPVMYWVIVTQAGTDNITELMADGGSVFSSALLAAYLFIIGMCGALLGAWLGGPGRRLRWLALACVVLALPIAYWVLTYGTAAAIDYGGQTFSALQFLLSTDREHYARGIELIARYMVFHVALVGTVALTQYPFWMNVIEQARRGVSSPRNVMWQSGYQGGNKLNSRLNQSKS